MNPRGQLIGLTDWRLPPPAPVLDRRRVAVAARGLALAVERGDGPGIDRWQSVLRRAS